jgi:hypothetical protein
VLWVAVIEQIRMVLLMPAVRHDQTDGNKAVVVIVK